MADVENPNEYDDEEFTNASNRADPAIQAMWEAGARLSDIEDTIANALANAGVPSGTVLTVMVSG